MKKNFASDAGITKLISKTSHYWAWEVDINYNYVYISKNVKEILGYEINEMLNLSPPDFMVDEDGKKFLIYLDSIRQTEESFWDLKVTFYSKNNQLIEFKMSGIPKYDDNDNFCGYVGICYEENIIISEKGPND